MHRTGCLQGKPPVATDGRPGDSGRPRSQKSSHRNPCSVKSPRSSSGAGRLRTPSNPPQQSPYLRPIKLQSRAREPLDIRSLLNSANLSHVATEVVPATLDRRPETAPTGSPLTRDPTSLSCTLEGLSTSSSSSQHDVQNTSSDQPGWEEEGDSEPPIRYVLNASDLENDTVSIRCFQQGMHRCVLAIGKVSAVCEWALEALSSTCISALLILAS